MSDSVTRTVEDVEALWSEARDHIRDRFDHLLVTADTVEAACRALERWYAIHGHRVTVMGRINEFEVRFTIIPAVIRKVTITGTVKV